MTCIVGLAHGGLVTIGGDSAGVAGLDLCVRREPKVFRNGSMIMGFTDSFRMGQLLAYILLVPYRRPDVDPLRFMATEFVDAVRACLKAGGLASMSNSVERGGTFLVGYEGRVFRVEGDYQIGEAEAGFDACGAGQSFALGALFNTAHLGPFDRVLAALKTAEMCSAGVRGPFRFETI